MKRKDSPYEDGRFPSGTNWEGYILWCLIEMGKECDREEAAKIDCAQKEAVAEMVTANSAGTGEEQGVGGPLLLDGIGTSDLLSVDEEDRYPNKKFFKCGSGFIAWVLWGHISTIIDSAGMQSDFFSDAKKKASFGRKTESRAAFRKMLIEKMQRVLTIVEGMASCRRRRGLFFDTNNACRFVLYSCEDSRVHGCRFHQK